MLKFSHVKSRFQASKQVVDKAKIVDALDVSVRWKLLVKGLEF